MIINTKESNEKGLWWIKIFNLGMKDICGYVVQVLCDQSGGGGGESKAHFRSQLGTGGLERCLIWSRDTWTATYLFEENHITNTYI